jgi:hypothetical protein
MKIFVAGATVAVGPTIGADALAHHTRLTGAANSRAKIELGLAPRPLLWSMHRNPRGPSPY